MKFTVLPKNKSFDISIKELDYDNNMMSLLTTDVIRIVTAK